MKPINIIKKLNESSQFDSKRVPEDEIKEKGYQYFSTHGTGPGTHPKDVKVIELDIELPGGWVTFKTDRPLTSDELNKYDIQPETKNSELRKRFGLKEDTNGEYKTFEVVVGWNGYVGVEEEYRIGAYNRVQAVNEAIYNPGSEAELDFSVESIEDNGDGSYDVDISWHDADEVYTVNADNEDDAQNRALEEAKEGLEIISVDGTEFSYDEAFEGCKPKNNKINEAEDIEKTDDEIKVYMNTWKNYNEYGADLEAYGIKDGWMTPEEAKEFAKKYSEDEPFINDTDNCPFEGVNEYSGLSVLDDLIKYNELEGYEKEVVSAILEAGSITDLNEAIEKAESGDYIFFPGVDNDEDLAHEYIDMCGGITSAVAQDRLDNYFDEESYKEENRDAFREMMAESEDKDVDDISDEEVDEWAEMVMQDEISTAKYDHNDDFFERYFDYKAFGDELSYDYTYTDEGAISTF